MAARPPAVELPCTISARYRTAPANPSARRAEHAERLSLTPRRAARHLLFRATGDRSHLDEAKRLLDEALAEVPEPYHEAMLTNLRVNREIMAAWSEHGGSQPTG